MHTPGLDGLFLLDDGEVLFVAAGIAQIGADGCGWLEGGDH